MKTSKILFTAIFFVCSLLLASGQAAKNEIKTIDSEALAQKLVTQCAGIHEGDLVLVSGGAKNMELLENICVNVRKLGAFPLLTVGSDRLTHLMFTSVPEKYDTQSPEMDIKLLNFINAIISISYNEDPAVIKDVSPERLARLTKASLQANEIARKKNIKIVSLGNGLYPSEAQAKLLGLSFAEMSDMFWKGVNTDYGKLESTGKSVKNILAAGKEVWLTNPNGTDIKVQIAQRPVFVSDGTISKEDEAGGYAAMQAYLPAGEVFQSTVPGTAEGKIVVDRVLFQDKEIEGLTLTIQKGKITSMTAKTGLDPFKAYYDAAETGKEDFSSIDLGINSDVKIKSGSKAAVWMPAGMVTVGIGNNTFAGGDNNSPFGYSFFIPGSTLKVDGKVLIENGMLKF